ncbi:restriction endonuclease S subunit [Rhodococcus sp. 27YEA15]|uniref:restriction endonuclease subunit S n=1 Tax=Rhodococcus sp. 27YEA15 TaxID=3156259 RepID=UPI003C7D10A1
MTERALPTGWGWATLGELGQWFGGGTPSKRKPEFWESGTIPWLSPKDMGMSLLVDTQDHITDAAVAGSATLLVPANSVALVVRSGILERRVPVSLVPFATTMNQDMKAVAPHAAVDSKWLLYTLQSQELVILHACRKAGTTVASLDTAKLHGLPIPLPPLPEQHRIVEALEDHLSRLDAADQTLQNARARLRLVRALYLNATLCSREVLASSTIGDECEVFVGATPSRANPTFWNGDFPWVSSGEVAFNRISTTRERITREAAGNVSTRVHPPGTVMMAMIGEGKTRGQVAILDIEAAHNQNCAAIRIDSSKFLSEFVYHSLRSRYEQNRNTGAGGVQPALNKQKVREIELPVFAIDDQRDIVAEIEDFDDAYTRAKISVDTALARSSTLRRSLLRMAFNGELVDQDHTDEPATVALAKIRDEQSGTISRRQRRVAATK